MFDVKYFDIKTARTNSPLCFFYDAIKGYRLFFIYEFFMAFILTLFKLGGVIYSSKLIGYFSSINVKDFEWNKALFYVFAILVAWILTHVTRYIRELVNEKVRQIIAWRSELYALNYINKLSSTYLKEQKAGVIAQRIKALGDNMWRQSLLFSRSFSCSWQIIIPLYFIGMKNTSFLVIVIIFGIISALFSFIVTKKSTELNKRSEEKNSQFSGFLADALTNILLIKMFGQEKSEKTKIEKKIEVVSAFLSKTSLVEKLIYAGQNFFLLMFRISCVFMGIYLWHTKNLDMESLIALLLLLNDLLPIFGRVLWEVSNFRNNLGKLADSIKTLQASIDIKDTPKAIKLNVKKGKIEFKNITFAYEKDNNVFENFNLIINPGEKIGIVGKSGSGKSTLISLLQREYDLIGGNIFIDGKDISKIKISSLKHAISLISQDNILFHRTIKKNISYGKLNASDNEIINASQLACADDFITETPYGYNTITGERGVKLSGGQRQRIAIARAILKNSPILILDEATSALDNQTEDKIIKGINNLMTGKTVIAIAHRLSTLKNMDKIIVIDKGRVIEEGTPYQLINKKGEFQKLWKYQK